MERQNQTKTYVQGKEPAADLQAVATQTTAVKPPGVRMFRERSIHSLGVLLLKAGKDHIAARGLRRAGEEEHVGDRNMCTSEHCCIP